jgi:hypothetical protein
VLTVSVLKSAAEAVIVFFLVRIDPRTIAGSASGWFDTHHFHVGTHSAQTSAGSDDQLGNVKAILSCAGQNRSV